MKLSSAGVFQWVATMGGGGSDQANGLAIDASGQSYLTGRFTGRASFDPAQVYDPDYPCDPQADAYCHESVHSDDVLLVKLSANGGHLWSRSFGGWGPDIGTSVAVDPHGNAVLVGRHAPGGIFLTQFDATGDQRWWHTLETNASNRRPFVAVAPQGDIWVTDSFEGTVDFDVGEWGVDAFTAVPDGHPDLFVMRLRAPLLDYADCNDNGIVDYCECIRGDFLEDGQVVGSDIQPFVDCLLGGDPEYQNCYCADMNRDEDLTAEGDIPCFVDALLGDDDNSCHIAEPCPGGDGPRGLEDCNSNEVPDANDIFSLTSQDCNHNWIPDECGYPDSCDIAAEISLDEDENGIPDECEGRGDDFAGGTPTPPDEGEGFAGGAPTLPGDPEASFDAWIEYYEWLDEQEWGPDSELNGAEQFQLMVDKLIELGLPVRNPCAR